MLHACLELERGNYASIAKELLMDPCKCCGQCPCRWYISPERTIELEADSRFWEEYDKDDEAYKGEE